MLPEHDSPSSSFLLPASLITQRLPAIPPIEHDLLLLLTQQTWQGTSYNSAWETQGCEALPPQGGDLAAALLGVQGYQIRQLIPLSSSTFSGIISTSPTLPSSHDEPIPTEHGPHPPMLPSYTGISPYRSPSSLPPHQPETRHQSSSSDLPQHQEQDSPSHEGMRSQIGMTERDDRKSESGQQRSEKSTYDSPVSGSIVKEKPSTTPPAIPVQRYSPLRNTSTVFEEVAPQPRKLPTPPQPTTPITISQALYLLVTGKLVQIPDVLARVPLINLFNYFLEELVADQDWARTPAGIDYAYYGYDYILKEEARHFTCQAYNMIHLDDPVQIPTHYQRPQIVLPSLFDTPEPMADEPLVPP